MALPGKPLVPCRLDGLASTRADAPMAKALGIEKPVTSPFSRLSLDGTGYLSSPIGCTSIPPTPSLFVEIPTNVDSHANAQLGVDSHAPLPGMTRFFSKLLSRVNQKPGADLAGPIWGHPSAPGVAEDLPTRSFSNPRTPSLAHRAGHVETRRRSPR